MGQSGGTNVGNLNATLTLSAWEFQNGLKQSEEAAREFATKTDQHVSNTNKSLNGLGNGMSGGGGAARAMTQIGFGIQDFSSQMSNSKNIADGLGRGIGAVANNVAMLGSAFGPTGMAVSAIGAAAAGIVLPTVIKWALNSEEIERSTKLTMDHYSQLADRAAFMAATKFDDPKGVLDRAKALEKEINTTEENRRLEGEKTEQLRQQLALLEKQAAALAKYQSIDGKHHSVQDQSAGEIKVAAEMPAAKAAFEAAKKRMKISMPMLL